MRTITLNEKALKREKVLTALRSGAVTHKQAAELIGVSERQLRRLLAAYKEEGVTALVHSNQGREPIHKTEHELRDRIVELASGKYRGFNHSHLTEKLNECEGITVSRSTVRRILLQERLPSPRKRRAPGHRSRRERYSQEGMLLQRDASPHAWLEDRGPRLTLFAAIDDATGLVPAAVFRETEDAAGYLELMRQVALTRGRPLAVYHDRHTIFGAKVRDVLEVPEPSQFGRVLAELGVESIKARSPQAKGRVERLFGTLQDRLCSELRLQGISSLEAANRMLGAFLIEHNERFRVDAQTQGTAYRPLEGDLDRVVCFKYERTVGMDNTVRFGHHRLQVLPSKRRRSYARAHVEVHERLDGSIGVYHQGELVAVEAAPVEAPVLRARSGRLTGAIKQEVSIPTSKPKEPKLPKQPYKPAPDHPWRKGWGSSGRVVDIPGGKSKGVAES